MIDKLTKEQEASMQGYVDKYLKIGMKTDRLDFDKAVEALKDFLGNDVGSRKFVFCKSPLEIPKNASSITLGAHDVHWVAYYEFFYDHFGICEEITKMLPIVNNCSWVYYDDDKIYVSDNPSSIKMDDQNRLHSENGPAITYTDGFEVYSWHGQRVPKEWIMQKENLGPEEFLRHRNAEMRRVACEIVGWNRVLETLSYVVIDEDGDPEIGSLLEVNIPDIGKEKFLKVMCGTKREFAIPVPPEAKTALEAQAMLFGLSVEEFVVPEIRT